MSGRNFREMIEAQWSRGKFVCVGLDSDISKIRALKIVPASDYLPDLQTIMVFNKIIVDVTCDLVCAYKPNTAFYEALGSTGWQALRNTIAYIHNVAPDVPVILDAKRADIGNTNSGYVEMAFEYLKADAITIHPYLGAESLGPFLSCSNKGIFVLCRTSNLGAGEFQDRNIYLTEEDCQELFYNEFTGECTMDIPNDPITMPFYQYVAYRVANHWNKNGNCALVVGATYPEELREVRSIVGDMPILIPGIGAQGGDVEKTVSAGKDSRGKGMIINSSRGIIFSDDPRAKTIELRDAINQSL